MRNSRVLERERETLVRRHVPECDGRSSKQIYERSKRLASSFLPFSRRFPPFVSLRESFGENRRLEKFSSYIELGAVSSFSGTHRLAGPTSPALEQKRCGGTRHPSSPLFPPALFTTLCVHRASLLTPRDPSHPASSTPLPRLTPLFSPLRFRAPSRQPRARC